MEAVRPKRPEPEKERGARRPEEWSAAEKLQIVLEASQLDEAQLGELLRRKGLHEAQLKQWQQTALEALDPAAKRGKPAESKRMKELERELRRKDKALAEAAALLVLRKKLDAPWEDAEDSATGQRSDDESSG